MTQRAAPSRSNLEARAPSTPPLDCVQIDSARHFGRAIALVFAVLAFSGLEAAESQELRWVQRGPALGPAIVLTHPLFSGIVYAQIVGLLYRSEDMGVTWELMTENLPPKTLVVLSPETADVLYAFIEYSNRILKSIDAGRNWNDVTTGLDPHTKLRAIAISPARPAALYAATTASCTQFFCYTNGGVFKSMTGGTRWEPSGLSGHDVYGLVASSSDPDVIYGFGPTEFFRSNDGGYSWNVSALPGQAFVGQFGSACSESCLIAIDATVPSTVFLVEWGGIEGLLKSTTGGQEWSRLTTGLPKAHDTIRGDLDFPPTAIVVDASDSATVYAGFSLYSSPPSLASCCGVFETRDGGSAWSAMNSGLTNLYLKGLAIDPSGQMLYAGTDAGVFELDFTQRAAVNPVSRSGQPRVLSPREEVLSPSSPLRSVLSHKPSDAPKKSYADKER